MPFQAGSVTGEIILRYDKAVKAINAVEHRTKTAMARMSGYVQKNQENIRIAGMGIAKVGGAIAGGLALGVRQAASFEAEMRNANAIMRVSEDRFAELSQEVVQLSRELPQTADVLAKGLYQLASGGIAVADSMDVLRAAATAAVAGVSDTATAASALIAVLNTYQLSGKDAARVSDVLFKTVEKGVLTFPQLADSIAMVISSAAPAGVTLEEVAAAMVVMTRSGFDAAMSSTALARAIEIFLNPSEKLAKALKRIGIENASLFIRTKGLTAAIAALNEVAEGTPALLAEIGIERRALRAAMALTRREGELFTEMLGEMKNAAGATQEAFEEQSKSFRVQWDLMKSSINALLITLGQKLLPMMQDYINQITKVTDAVAGWAGENEKLAAALAKVAVPLAALAIPLGLVIAMLPNFIRGIMEIGKAVGFLSRVFTGPAGIIGLLGLFAIEGWKAVRMLERMEDQAEKATDPLKEFLNLTKEQSNAYITLALRARELAQKTNLTMREQSELHTAMDKLGGLFPKIIRHYGDEKEAIGELTDLIELLCAARKEQIRLAGLAVAAEHRTLEAIEADLADVRFAIEWWIDELAKGTAMTAEQFERVEDVMRRLTALERDLEVELKAAKSAVDALAGDEAAGAAGVGGVSGLTTRLQDAAEAVKRLRQELARLPAGTTAWAEANAELNEALAEYNRLLARASLRGEVHLSLIDRIHVALTKQSVLYKMRLRQQEEESAALEEYARSYQSFITRMMRSLADWALSLDLPRLRLQNAIAEVVRLRHVMDGMEIALRTWASLFGVMGEAAVKAFEKIRYGTERAKQAGQTMVLIWQNVLERIQAAWANAIYNMMTGMSNLADFFRSTWDAVLRSLSELIAAHVAKWIAEITGLAKALENLKKAAGGGGLLGGALGFIGGLFGLQRGGIVTRPTVAALGERGPEAVIPLTPTVPAGSLGPLPGLVPALAGAGESNVSVGPVQLTVDSLDELSLRRMARRTMNAYGHELWRAGLRTSGRAA